MCCYWLGGISGYMLVQHLTDDSPNAEGGLTRMLNWLVFMCGILLAPKLVKYDPNLKIFMWFLSGMVIIGMFMLALVVDDGGNIRKFAYISCGLAVVGILLQMKFVEKEKKNLNVWICYLIVATGMLITLHFLDIGDYNRTFLWASFGLVALGVLMGTLIVNDASSKTGDKQIGTSTLVQLV